MLEQARTNVVRAVNSNMVVAEWKDDPYFVHEIQVKGACPQKSDW